MSHYRFELDRLYDFAESLAKVASIKLEAQVSCLNQNLPIFSFGFGNAPRSGPALLITGGVHGLEVIGMQVVYSFMDTLGQLLKWDATIKDQLEHLKIYMIPCVNPGGVLLGRRSNPNGVDLMRNAPVEGEGISPFFIGAGHRLSPKLPWFRGNPEYMEAEALALIDFCKQELFGREFNLIVDIHSGFGMRDRLWFPFAHTERPFDHLAEVVAFKELMDLTLPHHIYSVEPQSLHYKAHGDLWDHLFYLHRSHNPEALFLPFCLELGAWRWMRKNPKQIFRPIGLFHPMMDHRKKRVLRHHYPLFDFLVRSVASFQHWSQMSEVDRKRRLLRGLNDWYSQKRLSSITKDPYAPIIPLRDHTDTDTDTDTDTNTDIYTDPKSKSPHRDPQIESGAEQRLQVLPGRKTS